MRERPNRTVSKTVVGVRPPWVQIPLPPQKRWQQQKQLCQHLVVEHLDNCDLLGDEVKCLGGLVEGAPLDVPVASCPGWSLGDLVGHLGMVHRWAEYLVRHRAAERIPSEKMGLDGPDTSADWLIAGGERLVTTLRSADPDAPMWAWGPDHHVRFWSRRQLHETLVHRMDAELALGRLPQAGPRVAGDAVDEFLVNLPEAVYFSPKVKNLRGEGTRLAFWAEDTDCTWSVTLRPQGFEVVGGPSASEAKPDAMLSAPAVTLLLVLYRRLPIETAGTTVAGNRAWLEMWLANSALE